MSRNHKQISLDITHCCCDINKDLSLEQDGLRSPIQCKKETDRKHIARRRWGILAKALKSPISSQPSSPTDEISMRRFSTYMLLTPQPLQDDLNKHLDQQFINFSTENNISAEEKIKLHDTKAQQNVKRRPVQYRKRNWYRYTAQIQDLNYYVDIGHISRSFTAADLMGFNNTGNVCVWPSEEALAYYVLNNLDIFTDKTVLELGGGMSALAGLMVAKYGQAKLVNLTDGNALAVENVKLSLEHNAFSCIIRSEVLQWGTSDSKQEFDVILSADCLFFDEARNDLIETIWRALSQNGVAFVMAPKRGDTLEIFLAHSEMRGFHCRKTVVYNEAVWNRHLECLDNPDYDEDIHYPILLLLTKSSAS